MGLVILEQALCSIRLARVEGAYILHSFRSKVAAARQEHTTHRRIQSNLGAIFPCVLLPSKPRFTEKLGTIVASGATD
jgi:hypothetical protein